MLTPLSSMRRRRSRRLMRMESLELRLCLSAIRVVAWNTENGPDGAADEAHFSTVFQAIGQESVQGNAIRPTIIALQETDNAQGGGDSIARVDAILESLYSGTTYLRASSALDSGDDANGFVYDSALVSLVSTSVVQPTPGMTPFAHNILRGQFRPVGTNGPSDFYLYSTHLKAGSSGTDQNRRTAEANAIRLDIDSLGAGQDVLVMGDFNISGSNEGAYQNFLAAGDGQLFDPIDRPGQWKNNPSFVDVHTQNPEINGAGGMDDRFDFQLGTAAVFDDEGLQFIPGSYRAFGNNGTHTFNSDITTGTGASPQVLAALAAASDHLPVVADYELGINLPGISLLETGDGTSISEAGASDTYSVVLDVVPDADVVITVTPDTQSLVNGMSTLTLTFTPQDALTPQTITLTAVDDDVAEATHNTRINHAVSSTDSSFDSLSDSVLIASVGDNDGVNVVISEIMYNPASSEPDAEWVEIINLGNTAVDLGGWLLDDEDATNWGQIPNDTPQLMPGKVAVIHNQVIGSSDFRNRWSVPDSSLLIGVSWGSLANGPSLGSEILSLLNDSGQTQDLVNYDDDGTNWPADNGQSSIYLPDPTLSNNDGGNWALSVDGIDGASRPSGAPFSGSDVGSPGVVTGVPVVPPVILETRIDENRADDLQRSMVRSLTVVFDRPVTAPSAAFQLDRLDPPAGGNADVELSVTVAEVQGRGEARLTFSGTNVDANSGSLLDGNYRLTINGSLVSGASDGVLLDGDGDGQPGGDTVLGDTVDEALFRLFGDTDGDRDIDASDWRDFARSFRSTSGQDAYDELSDHDADGHVGVEDLGQLRRRLLTTLEF